MPRATLLSLSSQCCVSSRSRYPQCQDPRCWACFGRHAPEIFIRSGCWWWSSCRWLLQGWHPRVSERNAAPGKRRRASSALSSTKLQDSQGPLGRWKPRGPPAALRCPIPMGCEYKDSLTFIFFHKTVAVWNFYNVAERILYKNSRQNNQFILRYGRIISLFSISAFLRVPCKTMWRYSRKATNIIFHYKELQSPTTLWRLNMAFKLRLLQNHFLIYSEDFIFYTYTYTYGYISVSLWVLFHLFKCP